MNSNHKKPIAWKLTITGLTLAGILAIPLLGHAEQVTHSYDDLNRLIQSDYGNGNVIDYTYDAAGNRTSQKVTTATVPNQPPTANAGSDQTISLGSLATLHGSGSDPDNDSSTLTFSWTQNSGPTVTLTGASTASPTFTPTTVGLYTFTLTVSDGLASALDEVKIEVVSNQSVTLKVTQLLINKKLKTFFLLSNFTLGTGNGIDPLKEAVSFKIGNFTTTIPAGSFRKPSKLLPFAYAGTINKVKLEVLITQLGVNRYGFQAGGIGVNFSGITNPVTVDLSIGDDNGTTSVNATIK